MESHAGARRVAERHLKAKDLVRRTIAPFVYGDHAVILPRRMQSAWAERKFRHQLLSSLSIDCVWDVGANVGQFASELRVLGYKGLIFSFEPDPTAFQVLSTRAAHDRNWVTFNVALGRQTEKRDLNIMAFSQYNSFLEPSALETESHLKANSIVNKVMVSIETINDLFYELVKKHNFHRPHLKMDTQGFDLEVFAGAERVRDKFVSIQSEIAVKKIYYGSPGWRESLAVYEENGYQIVGLFDVNLFNGPLVEMNCYMQKVRVPIGDQEAPRL